ncbi:MAG TPA: hypothetical protein VFV91_08875 [Gaiellaceae bacterium]|nr:hypothetical protein [Gaiellaceae bacterium]
MRPDDFFVEDAVPGEFGSASRYLNVELLGAIRRGSVADHEDIELAVPLARLVHDDLERYGTSGGTEMTEEGIREALLALRAVVDRVGVSDFEVPFRDFGTFRSWWLKNNAYGSWQARRDLLSGIFDPLHDQLADLEQHALTSSLVESVSPHARTGWSVVDTEISELRRHFRTARTPQDYRNVGQDCVAVTETLSRQVYDPARHLREGEEEPPVANTKQRLGRFIEDAAPGSDNAALRKLARAVIEYAQHVKHSTTPTQREAGIAADAVIQLANLLRRLEEDKSEEEEEDKSEEEEEG